MLGNGLGKDGIAHCQRLSRKFPEKIYDGLSLQQSHWRVDGVGKGAVREGLRACIAV